MSRESETLFLKLYNSKRKQIFFFAVTMGILCVTYICLMNQINRKAEIIQDDYSWVFQIDRIQEENDLLTVEGWAFELGKTAEPGKYEVLLREAETEKQYYLDMLYTKRIDVDEYFSCEFDYCESGFKASIPTEKLDLENKTYEVIIKHKGKRKAYATSTFFANGELTFIDPRDFVPLQIESTDLASIVNNGILKVYRPEVGMYVYQYNQDLYWIAEPKYDFAAGREYIQYQLNTTQIDKLPKDRLANGWFWSNISFDFTTNEISEWDTGKYRVAKMEIPKEYSVTDIHTGCYDGYWVWVQYFRPYYDFAK